MTNGLRCSQYEAKERQQADIMHQLQAAQQQPTAPAAAPKRKHVKKEDIELGGGSLPKRKHFEKTSSWGASASQTENTSGGTLRTGVGLQRTPPPGAAPNTGPASMLMYGLHRIYSSAMGCIQRGLDTGW